ncbi:TolC family protein [Saccharicrinis fermentans]|uniref:Type I secretion outer membrane protein n=1 Tax=Saccharicrinis fermentans DSM 9555 = JCM 21142 TaxID=869213 RepID=W7XVZ2_9BACT|nr:TolC family protein [Saccharicrinis fermentans]GAF02425.1 type I secretion outer membrane protein [Saccharicrinis fermentans DSM 9555 = JCM 21142]
MLIQEIVAQIDGQTQRFKMGTNYSSSFGARAEQLLFDGSYLVGLQASKVYVRLSDNAKEKTDIEIKQAVAEVYFLASMAEKNIQEFERSLKINEKTYQETKVYFDNGMKEDIDVDQIKLMVNESRRLYQEALRQKAITMAILKFSMGYDIDKPLIVTESVTELLSPIPLNPELDFEMNTHIDYKTLLTQIDIQGLDIKNQKTLALPRLTGFASYDYTMLGDQLNDLINTDAAAIGLTLSIPIFSSGSRSAQLKQKKLELTKLTVEKQMLEQSLKRDLLVAETNLKNGKIQYDNAKEALDISTRIYHKSLVKFKNGIMNSLQLSQIENSMIEAVITLSQASSNYFNMYINYQKITSQL